MRRFPSCVAVLSAVMCLLIATELRAAVSTVKAGYDLLQSVTGTNVNGVPFLGVPLGTFNFGGSIGVQNTGNTDTIVQRLSDTSVNTTPNTASPINIQISTLQLESAAPTDFGLGTDFYFLTLQSTHGGNPSTGQIDVTFNNANGGTFTSFFDVFFDIRKGSLSGPIAQSSSTLLTNNMTNWSRTAPSNAVLINGVDNNLNGTDTTADFWPQGTFTEADGNMSQSLTDATPEPSSAAILFVGVVSMLVCRRSRKR